MIKPKPSAPGKKSGRRAPRGNTGGHTFIVMTTSTNPSKHDRSLAKSHASLKSRRRIGHPSLMPWTDPEDDPPEQSEQIRKYMYPDHSAPPIPPRVGSELELIDLPETIKPYMKSILDSQFSPYPRDIVTHIDPLRTAWTAYLLNDEVYLHSMLFWIEAFRSMRRNEFESPLAHFYLMKTLRLLQERLSSPGDPLSVSDPTIMVIVGLAVSSELFGDRTAAEKHMAGLFDMVRLRGGLSTLRAESHRLPVKVCRVDIGFALRFGCNPFFYREILSWDPYLKDEKSPRRLSIATDDEARVFIESLDTRLINVWHDLREFARICNLAQQTGYGMTPTVFGEILVSIFYRLLRLEYNECLISETLRLAMLAFASAIFFEWQGMKQRQVYLHQKYAESLLRLLRSPIKYPRAIRVWLALTWIALETNDSNRSEYAELDEAIKSILAGSWAENRALAKNLIWIDCIFDEPCRHAHGRITQAVIDLTKSAKAL